MNSFDTILFDLDGTLTDSYEGISKSVQYALKSLGIEENEERVLRSFIGPSLKEQFKKVYRLSDSDTEKAVKTYRERFSVTGIYENRLYEGITEMLERLKSSGKRLAIASSKPRVFVSTVLKYFDIAKYFEIEGGSELDGRRIEKSDVIEYTLKLLDIKDRQRVVMVGDRCFDAEGAKICNVPFIGVLYGYGSYEELSQYENRGLAKNVPDLCEMLLKSY